MASEPGRERLAVLLEDARIAIELLGGLLNRWLAPILNYDPARMVAAE